MSGNFSLVNGTTPPPPWDSSGVQTADGSSTIHVFRSVVVVVVDDDVVVISCFQVFMLSATKQSSMFIFHSCLGKAFFLCDVQSAEDNEDVFPMHIVTSTAHQAKHNHSPLSP